ncbi:MAG: hypothetical protein OXS47_04160, partial [Chloroflexota bacterium]|nr:hypothetical protein [Chloroflexota bacterium]
TATLRAYRNPTNKPSDDPTRKTSVFLVKAVGDVPCGVRHKKSRCEKLRKIRDASLPIPTGGTKEC